MPAVPTKEKIWDVYMDLTIIDIYRKSKTNQKGERWMYKVKCWLCWKIFDMRKHDRGKTERCKSCAIRKCRLVYSINKNKKLIWEHFWYLTITWITRWRFGHPNRCEVLCWCWHVSQKDIDDVTSWKINYCWRWSKCSAKYPKNFDNDPYGFVWKTWWSWYIRKCRWTRTKHKWKHRRTTTKIIREYLCECKCWEKKWVSFWRLTKLAPIKCKCLKEKYIGLF